jgi:acetylornithine deacetylase
VTEPTDLDVAVAHKGFQWLTVETRGRAAHGSRPLEGRDAILRMGRVLTALEALDRRLQHGPAHPLLGTASLHASLVHGGQELSSYPERAWLELERRTLPGEPADVGLVELRQILDDVKVADPEFEGDARLALGREPYEMPAGHEISERLQREAHAVGCRAHRVGMTFWTDAAILGAAGVPTVLFGPGGAGLHSTEEYVFVDDVQKCRDALVRLTRTYLRE